MSESEIRETESVPNIITHQEQGQNQDEVNTLDKAQPTRTLALIKPDAMQANHKNAIIEKIKEHGFTVVQEREIHLTKEKAGLFYQEHENKPFYDELTSWMSR
ncbi:nucleoside diphosphate kinase [Choanephora cucurbitarum]|nr:nucleoside diphosphate kinase [Choanephora cucurbitarum]